MQTIYRRSRLKTFPEPEKIEGQKGGKQWVRTDVTKWVKANVKPDEEKIIKLELKEQAKAEADDAMVLGAMSTIWQTTPTFFQKHKWTIYAVSVGWLLLLRRG